MPFPMIHMEVARRIECRMNIESPAQYYLGAIAPDAVHIRAQVTGADKKASHICADSAAWGEVEDNPAWRADVLAYLRARPVDDADFLLGYCVHILTDICWNERIYIPFRRRFDGSQKAMRPAYRNDCFHVEGALCGLCDWREEMRAYWESAKGISILNIRADELDAWGAMVPRLWEEAPEQVDASLYFFLADALDFIRDASEAICVQIAGDMP